ncbi:MAG: homoserine O-acetyltransferase [Chitinophagaceae bacterium]|nr:homoserine O-acetyltransferase [Chitinophagaceae bacterium]
MPEIFKYNDPFTLETGEELNGYHLAYTTYGTLNASGDNVVWVFHALTANSDPAEWWPGLVGEGKLFDPAEYFIVCVNMPGSCYGSTGPLEINPGTRQPYYHTFPFFTIRDMIRSYQPLRKFLGIEKIHIGIGGSMGGQQLLEWAIEEPELFRHIFPIATNAQHSPWAIAFNASQRFCIETDPTFKENDPAAGLNGMKTARSVALLSYRSYDTYKIGQAEVSNEKVAEFNSESYQRYQGEKLAARFNAFSYYALSKSMDSHNVGRGRNSSMEALRKIRARTLSIGIRSDLLFPVEEQEYLAAHIEEAKFREIDSYYGHDGFLLEFDQIQKHIIDFISKDRLASQKLETTN